MKTQRRHYINFDIAGFSYWDGCEVFNELKIGTELKILREEDNKFDPYAVAIYYGESKLGFVPRNANHDISTLKGYAWKYIGIRQIHFHKDNRLIV